MAKLLGYPSWDEALTEALEQVASVPPEHNVYEVNFGTFAESVGGGHYVCIRVNYEVGNTKKAPVDREIVRRRRVGLVAEAWRAKAFEGRLGGAS